MRVCGCNTAGVVLTGAAVDQFKSGLERMRSFDPAECVRELHQRARIEARRRAGAVEWRVISHGRAADRSELLVEQFALQLREGGQSFLGGLGDVCFFCTADTAADVEWRPAEPAVSFHSPPRFVQQRSGHCRGPGRGVYVREPADLAEESLGKVGKSCLSGYTPVFFPAH